MLVQSPRATTGCEFDLARKPDCENGSNLRSPDKKELSARSRPTTKSWWRARSRQDQAASRRPLRAGLDL